MRASAAHDDREIAGPAARAGQRAVRQRRLVGQRRDLAARRPRKQPRGGKRTRFLVRIDHHFIAQTRGERRCLHRLQRGKKQRKPALHVGDAGAVQRVGVKETQLLKRMIGRIDGIHMAGEQHLHRRLRPHRQVEVAAVIERGDAAVGAHALGRFGRFHRDRSGQGAERLFQPGADPLQPRQVAGSAVDRRPVLHLLQHRRRVDAVDRIALGHCHFGHGSGSSRKVRG